MSNLLGRHAYCFNSEDNSGEALILLTEFMADDYDYDEDSFYLYQELSFESYGNSASLQLNDMITPKKLRKLANELEVEANRIGYHFNE